MVKIWFVNIFGRYLQPFYYQKTLNGERIRNFK